MSAARSQQLDGLRGLAVLGVAWFHWAPPGWRVPFPFEAGLFFFFVASGFLVTSNLLRERARGTGGGAVWRRFLARRGLRILTPYLGALALAAVLGAGDVRSAAPWYVLPLCNVHMALTGIEPAGITHFWTLAIQQQFYLLWPALVLFMPRRALPAVVAVLVLVAPLWRMVGPMLVPGVPDPSLFGITALDYFGCGTLLALARWRQPEGRLRGLVPLAWLALAGYGVLYAAWSAGQPVPGLRWFQQTLLAVACCGMIDAAVRGHAGRWLDHPVLQRAGTLSYSLFLFHNLSPLIAGWLAPALWTPGFDTPAGHLLRLAAFAALSWAMAAASWRWLEQPAEHLRRRIPAG